MDLWTRREFCALLGATAIGVGRAARTVALRAAESSPAPESPLFCSLALPILADDSDALAGTIGRFMRGEIPATVVLRGESFVSPRRLTAICAVLTACGMNPLVSIGALHPDGQPLRRIAPNVLAEFDGATPKTLVFLDPAHGGWTGYSAVSEIRSAPLSRFNARLQFARRVDGALKGRV